MRTPRRNVPQRQKVTQTVQHRSSKAANLMATPMDTPGRDSRAKSPYDVDNVRELDTKKYLHTNLQEYLEKDEHVTCISCQHCVRHKDKLIQYKYQRGLKSSYADTYANGFGNHKMRQFNLDKERRHLKVPYQPPRTFVTTNEANLFNSKGSGLIGAMT